MSAWAVRTFLIAALSPLAAAPALAQRTAVQEVPCEAGPELLLARDGTVSSCRLTVVGELLVGPAAGNPNVTCAAGVRVEFHRNGYLAFCDSAAAAAAYMTRGSRSSRCRVGARLAFDENGFLEYCS
ncbi:MAG: hypothetical protein WAS21_32245 [Geminicoccaceae bacterium]|jgi:hypothetical protein